MFSTNPRFSKTIRNYSMTESELNGMIRNYASYLKYHYSDVSNTGNAMCFEDWMTNEIMMH